MFLLGVLEWCCTTGFVWCTTWLVPGNSFAPLGLNRNDDIHSTTRLISNWPKPYSDLQDHLGQFTPLHHLVCNFLAKTLKLAMLLGEQQPQLQPQLQHWPWFQPRRSWTEQVGPEIAHSAVSISGLPRIQLELRDLGEQFWEQNQLKLQTCEGHVDGAESSKVQLGNG